MFESITSYALENFPILITIVLIILFVIYTWIILGIKFVRIAINGHIEKDQADHENLGVKIKENDEKSRLRDKRIEDKIEKQEQDSIARDKGLEGQLNKQHEKLEGIGTDVAVMSALLKQSEKEK